MRYLTRQELIELNKQAVEIVDGKYFGVQSESALDIIIEQPQQVIFGKELYPTIWLKAGFILQKITKKHVFTDGNKRTAILASLYFLNLNGKTIDEKIINRDGEELMLAVTNSPDEEKIMIKIAKWLEKICN
ncbi:type II toxin-antitoxin system death-on-curing family toxin [Fructilactobacillus florum]|uniref:Toxin-antitoxin system, toxin component, Fic family protein n=1 Tax=Fructilactobacillus florum DSM 22689 = JCM 16035 TaxID=1423745 RepID=A0A0R2CJU6_9LACO|nr:type II toxin-antitoxin system death-on-curing family toxin [Fructilactobacillus florum]KRM91886.1 toxin-antitoxin system, toxin component, Fic family protein [Fructilactobacillus florum DSM 22689 = JCM 16035]